MAALDALRGVIAGGGVEGWNAASDALMTLSRAQRDEEAWGISDIIFNAAANESLRDDDVPSNEAVLHAIVKVRELAALTNLNKNAAFEQSSVCRAIHRTCMTLPAMREC